jgi:hypothetical protein
MTKNINDLYMGQTVICINHKDCKHKYSECGDCRICDTQNKPEECEVEHECDCEHAEPHTKEICDDPWCPRAMDMAGCFPVWRIRLELVDNGVRHRM